MALMTRQAGNVQGKRVLIFIVAYNAEKTIGSVLKRIPVDLLPADAEVLVIDDSSSDSTFQKAMEHRDAMQGMKLTVLFNPENQGYGGNQKLGYEYAIENGFDVVALVHGDGQYAPERLPVLLKPVLDGDADACFGSRMMERGQALKDGMPLYKYIGNKILTFYENGMLGTNLSEFHSGYRIYSVKGLKQIPFKYNSNDFHFDTEIIIQFILRGLRLREISIPTYYGDEICYVNGLKYAWNVFRTTLASRIHKAGIMYHRKYDVLPKDEPVYDIKLGYASSHTMAIAAIRPGTAVLDVGCGAGLVAKELSGKGCWVTGIDRVRADTTFLVKFLLQDLNNPTLPENIGSFDHILMLDCLEHLDSPERLLEEIRTRCFSEKTTVIMTTANIAFFLTRLGLLFGEFNYGRQGILDLSHKRLFTFSSFRRMLEQEGYEITRVRGVPAPFVKAMGDTRTARFLLNLNRFLMLFSRRMFAYQICVEARIKPPLDRLLARTIETSAEMEAPDEAAS